MKTFEYGSRVVHPLHGEGHALDTYPDENLVQVHFDGNQMVKMVHPETLTVVTAVKFEVSIEWNDGSVTRSGPLSKREVRRYMSNLDEEKMDSYTVSRLKTVEERQVDYFK